MPQEKAPPTEKAALAASTEIIPDARAVVAAPPADRPLATASSPAARKPAPANICTALAMAQQKCKVVRKDAVNTFHRYRYASAEAVIAEAKAALADTGLALVPIEQSLNRTPNGGYELIRKFMLLHESGESIPLCCAWPVVEEKGRPVDKATAISATASLAYILRDLLLMPRVNAEDDLPGRRDRPVVRPPVAATAPANGAPVQSPSPATSSSSTPESPPVAETAPTAAPTVRGEQLDLIDSLAHELGYGADALARRLVKSFGQGDPRRLSAEQAERVITGLEAAKAARAAKE